MVKVILNIHGDFAKNEPIEVVVNLKSLENISSKEEQLAKAEPENMIDPIFTLKRFDPVIHLDKNVGNKILIIGPAQKKRSQLEQEIAETRQWYSGIVVTEDDSWDQTSCNVYKEYKESIILPAVNAMRSAIIPKQKVDRLVVFEDFPTDPKCYNNEIFQWLAYNSRRDHVTWISTIQYLHMMPFPIFRQMTYVAIGKSSSERDAFYKHFAGFFGMGKKEWDKLYSAFSLREDATYLLINQVSDSVKLEDRIFIY